MTGNQLLPARVMLVVASLVTLLLTVVHLTQDVLHKPEGTNLYPIPVVVFALWMTGTLLASDRIWGLVMMLFGGLIGAAMIVVHSPGGVVTKSQGFAFVFTNFLLSTTGWFTMIL